MASAPASCSAGCGWEVVETDLFCSHCGQQLFQFEVEPAQVRLYGSPSDAEPARTAVKIGDGGWGRPKFTCINLPPWLLFEPPGTLRVDVDGLDDFNPKPAHITFQACPTDLVHDVEVSLWPKPALQFNQVKLARGFVRGAPAKLEAARLVVPLEIERMVFDPPWLESAVKLPYLLNPTPDLSRRVLHLPVRTTERAGNENRQISCTLWARGLAEPVTAAINLVFEDSPRLRIEEVGQEVRLLDGEGEFTLTFVNEHSKSVLWVEAISIHATDRAAPQLSFSVKQVRFSLEPGQTVEVLVEARRKGTQKLGHWFFDTLIDCNDPRVALKPQPLIIAVHDDALDGFVAVDYGTTDSTVAIVRKNPLGPANISLDRDSSDLKIYSNIYFQDWTPDDDPPYSWIIGRDARTLGQGIEARSRLLKAMKVEIGKPGIHRIPFPDKKHLAQLTAEQVVRYILIDLLRRTRRSLGRRPEKFVLCVPTRFSLRRKRLLKQEFLNAARHIGLAQLEERDVKLVDESLAAGLYCLRSPKREGTASVMVVYFGGGTTDITVFQVTWRGRGLDPDCVRIVGAWGDPNLGGEDITREIAKGLVLRNAAVNQGSGPLSERSVEPQAEDLKLVVSALENHLMRNPASDVDSLEKSLDEDIRKRLAGLLPPDLPLREFLAKDFMVSREVPIGLLKIRAAAKDVLDIYEKKLAGLKGDLQRMLQHIGLPRVDYLYLAGQSSQFPVVGRTLKDLAANDWEFVSDPDGNLALKECVAWGALRLAGRDLKVEGDKRLWNRLGYEAGGEFHELIEWGSAYPSPFTLNEDFHRGGRLKLELMENMRWMGAEEQELERFGRFEYELPRRESFECRISLDTEGSVILECQDGDLQWKRMSMAG